MCKGELESVDHLLLPCQFARAIWGLAFSCLGIFWIASNSTYKHPLARQGLLVSEKEGLGFTLCDFLQPLERTESKCLRGGRHFPSTFIKSLCFWD